MGSSEGFHGWPLNRGYILHSYVHGVISGKDRPVGLMLDSEFC